MARSRKVNPANTKQRRFTRNLEGKLILFVTLNSLKASRNHFNASSNYLIDYVYIFSKHRVFEFRAKIPLVKNLKIQVMDYDFPDPDDLIGETEIDLEQRLLSRYHATCGLPKTYFKYVALIMYYSKHPLIRTYFFPRGLILLILKYCVKNCNTMVFGILLWRGSKAILTIGLNLSSLGPIDLIRGKFYVASRRAQFLDLFCLLFTLMIFLMSLVSLNLYCLLMTQVSFVPIKMPTTSFLLLTMNLQK